MSDFADVKAQLIQDRELLNDLAYKVGLLESDRQRIAYDAITNIERACQWLGKAMGAINTPTPYPKSFDYKDPRIEPRANAKRTPFPEGLMDDVEDEDIAYAKWFRHHLKLIEKSILNTKQGVTDSAEFQACLHNAWTYCSNACMDFGMVLNDIRDEDEEPEAEEVPLTLEEASKSATAQVEGLRKLDKDNTEGVDPNPGENQAGGDEDSTNHTAEAKQTGIGAPIDMPSAVHPEANDDQEAAKIRADYDKDQLEKQAKAATKQDPKSLQQERASSVGQPINPAFLDAKATSTNAQPAKAEAAKAQPKTDAKTPAKATETKKETGK